MALTSCLHRSVSLDSWSFYISNADQDCLYNNGLGLLQLIRVD